jgi:outer membrane protein OmpA-like peptidoglycan-associated protein
MKHLFILASIMISCLTANSQSIKKGLFDHSTVKITEIKTNTIRSDFGPAIVEDSIFFTSFHDELKMKSDTKMKNREFYDIYKAGIDDSGNVKGKREVVNEFIAKFHDGPVSWCAKTGELFVTQSNYNNPSVKFKPFRKENINLRIVIAKKLSDKWVVVEEFPFNNANYSVGHPSINETGDTLYFASDMPGGFGATDIYKSVRKIGKWSEPVNLGEKINTNGKEEFPFVTGNSYPGSFLIFASSGHNSNRGFDLFYQKLNDLTDAVHQFSEPINSNYDDFAINIPENRSYGFMTSNRPGTGNDDIYKITVNNYVEYMLEILVLDASTLKPIPEAKVDFYNHKSVKTGSDGLASCPFEKTPVCNISASAFGYKDKSKLIKIETPKQGNVLRDTLFLDNIVIEKVVLKNIYYDFDKWNILPESAVELDQLVSFMKQNPQMKVELNSHTDSRGSATYNFKLSQLRVQAAVDYLVLRGIDQSKITGKGFGESQLFNKCFDGQQCTPAQHRENRRTEVNIPGFFKGEPVRQN